MSDVDLLATTDATVWAAQFMKTFGGRITDVDEDLLVTWFANAFAAAEVSQTFVEACDQASNRILFYSIVNAGEADRELATAKTNIEQAQMWFTRALAIIQGKFNPTDLEKANVTESV